MKYKIKERVEGDRKRTRGNSPLELKNKIDKSCDVPRFKETLLNISKKRLRPQICFQCP